MGEQDALHLRLCKQTQRFRPEHDHWSVADRHSPGHGSADGNSDTARAEINHKGR